VDGVHIRITRHIVPNNAEWLTSNPNTAIQYDDLRFVRPHTLVNDVLFHAITST
jgi:hypothetical protein